VLEEVTAWQQRPLESCYAVVLFDCLRVAIRDEAIGAVFPQTQVHPGVVHLVRRSLAYVGWQDRKARGHRAAGGLPGGDGAGGLRGGADARRYPIAPIWGARLAGSSSLLSANHC
jgi:hypothetical protein